MSELNNIEGKLKAYKRKYYLSLLVKGVLTTLLIISSIFIVGAILEHTLWMNSWLRGVLLFSMLGLLIWLGYKNILLPILFMVHLKSGITDDNAAKNLGKFFPIISDKLLNFLQLKNIQGNNPLVIASLDQKESDFRNIDFSTAINLKYSFNPLRYLAIPLFIIVLISLWNPGLFTSSTKRIIQFQESFAPAAPFAFDVLNKEMVAFENESFTIQLKIFGKSIPNDVYIVEGGRKIKMQSSDNQHFEYTYEKLKSSKTLHFEAAGFSSKHFQLIIVPRPTLNSFDVELNFPKYIQRKPEHLSNIGNLTIPEGTTVIWRLNAHETEEAIFTFTDAGSQKIEQANIIENGMVLHTRKINTSLDYDISLQNQFGKNKELLQYTIDVIRDAHPTIQLNTFQDTTLYTFISLGGSISDDYGMTNLKLFYSTDTKAYHSIDIPFDKRQPQQNFYYLWQFDSALLKQGRTLSYYLQVWDNDAINGFKTSKTQIRTFQIPTKHQVKEKIKIAAKESKKDLNEIIQEANELNKKLKEAEQKLKGKKELTWQDEKLIEDILKKKEELNKAIEELQEQNKLNSLQQQRFSEQNKNINEKLEQIQQIMDEILDEETKALYQELQRLLEEQKDVDQIQDLMEQINHKENNLEKELELTLERFKQMKFEYEVDQKVEELKQLSKTQEELKEQTGVKKSNNDSLSNKQEEIEKEFDAIMEEYKELEKLGEELKTPRELPDMDMTMEEIKEAFEQAKDALKNEKTKQAQKTQEELSQKMQQMAKQLDEMMAGMEMMMQQQNLDFLRDIVHNLLKLSFDQENLMNEFREVDQSDPRFVELSQQQIKLNENSDIVKDSLESLAGRVFQIQSFITRELNDLNRYMDESSEAIKDRKKNDAISKQQFAMTSMNNLALLLDDVLQQMQQQMADAMKGQGKPQKGQENMPGLGELQRELNQRIEDLKNSGKSGRQLSEELAKMAAEQERIRKALEEAQEKLGQMEGGEKPGNGISEKMEETELDLVNKQITDETIKRQREILTRLLEAEEALREREQDQEREAETAKQKQNIMPKVFEEYLKMKQKEIELLKTVPPKLYPYYKKEVNDYFERIGNTP